MSSEVIHLTVTARYRAGQEVEVDSGRLTFQAEQRTQRHDVACPIEPVLNGSGDCTFLTMAADAKGLTV